MDIMAGDAILTAIHIGREVITQIIITMGEIITTTTTTTTMETVIMTIQKGPIKEVVDLG